MNADREVSSHYSVRAFSVALLAAALVGAQIAGVEHRIAHAPGSDQHRAHWQALLHDRNDEEHSREDHAHHVHDGGDEAPAHDCAAYDAATLGDGPPIASSKPAATPPPQSARSTGGNAVVDNCPHLPFHSRAPPRA